METKGLPSKLEINKPKTFLTSIESIRGIAALYVALGHTLSGTVFTDYAKSIQDQHHIKDFSVKLLASAFNASTAVIVFFAISGLVIGLSLDKKNTMSPINYIYFLVRRILRIYPAHIFVLLFLMMIMMQFVVGHSWVAVPCPEALSNVEFNKMLNGNPFATASWSKVLKNFLLKNFALNPVTWSLHVEIIAAFFLPLFHKISREKNLYVDVGMLGTLFMMTIYGYGHFSTDYLFVFYLGLLIQTQGQRIATFFSEKLGRTNRAIVLSYVMMMLPGAVTVGRRPVVLIIEGISAFILLSLVVWGRKESFVQTLNSRWFAWNGRLSYSFYLWHFMILLFMLRVAYSYITPATWHRFEWLLFIGIGLVSCSLSWLLANFSYQYVEKPCMRLWKHVDFSSFFAAIKVFSQRFKRREYNIDNVG